MPTKRIYRYYLIKYYDVHFDLMLLALQSINRELKLLTSNTCEIRSTDSEYLRIIVHRFHIEVYGTCSYSEHELLKSKCTQTDFLEFSKRNYD